MKTVVLLFFLLIGSSLVASQTDIECFSDCTQRTIDSVDYLVLDTFKGALEMTQIDCDENNQEVIFWTEQSNEYIFKFPVIVQLILENSNDFIHFYNGEDLYEMDAEEISPDFRNELIAERQDLIDAAESEDWQFFSTALSNIIELEDSWH